MNARSDERRDHLTLKSRVCTSFFSFFSTIIFHLFFWNFSKIFQDFLVFFRIKNIEKIRVIRLDGDLIKSVDRTTQDQVKGQLG